MKKHVINDKAQNLVILEQLAGLLDGSLARYLSYARPWSRRTYTLLGAVSRKLAAEHERYAREIMELLHKRRHVARLPGFRMEYTYFNDVSLEYLAPKLLEQQRLLIGYVKAASGSLSADREANRLIRELFTSLCQSAELLQELLEPQGDAPATKDRVARSRLARIRRRRKKRASAASVPQAAA